MSLFHQLRSAVPPGLQPVSRSVFHGLFRVWLRLSCWCSDLAEASAASEIPMPSALMRFRVSEDLSRREFRRMGEHCASIIEQHALARSAGLANCRRVLDFGCGCGRTLFWLVRRYPCVEFHGVDVDREAIDWCRLHLDSARFVASPITPPLPYPDQHFDLVYCFSVFTHLDEGLQDLWLDELHRIVRRDGILLLTVHGGRAAEVLDADDRLKLNTAGFLFKSSGKLKGLVPPWYQTAWHSEDYIVRRISRWFRDVRYTSIPDGMQDIVTARKDDE